MVRTILHRNHATLVFLICNFTNLKPAARVKAAILVPVHHALFEGTDRLTGAARQV